MGCELERPGAGFTFRERTGGLLPRSATTDAESGVVTFTVPRNRPPDPVRAKLTEDPRAGYEIVPVDGRNATCRRGDGRRVPATNLGDSGFRVTTIPDDLISCVVYDRATTPAGLAQAPPAPTADDPLPSTGDALPTTGADLRYPTGAGVLAVVAGVVLVAGYPRRRPAATARPRPATGRLHRDAWSNR